MWRRETYYLKEISENYKSLRMCYNCLTLVLYVVQYTQTHTYTHLKCMTKQLEEIIFLCIVILSGNALKEHLFRTLFHHRCCVYER